MRRSEAEVWIDSVVSRVLHGGKVEDAFVEAKREWPADHWKAARRIAGHANAAAGDPILWIIGLDEDAHRLHAVDQTETHEWFAKVRRWFDFEITPEVRDVRMTIDGSPIVGLVFTTDNPPYMVTAGPTGGTIQREIPWRAGTEVKSANRMQVLRVLLKKAQALHADILTATLAPQSTRRAEGADQVEYLELRLHLRAYLYWKNESALVLPKHRMRLDGLDELPLHGVAVHLWGKEDWQVHHFESEIVAERSGVIYLSFSIYTKLKPTERPNPVELVAVFESDTPDVNLRLPLRFDLVGSSEYRLRA